MIAALAARPRWPEKGLASGDVGLVACGPTVTGRKEVRPVNVESIWVLPGFAWSGD